MRVQHPNIILPEEIISTFVGWYLVVLPKLVSLNLALDLSHPLHPKNPMINKFWGMSHDLASGLQFLHDLGIAHLDIKPSNLVYHPRTFVLQIIDFNSAVWVKNEDETISGHQGTLFWMAPGLYTLYAHHININLVSYLEVSQDIPFRPILADRYSCGVVFHQMAGAAKEAGGKERRWIELQSFACQLMNSNPCLRPALNMYGLNPLQAMNC